MKMNINNWKEFTIQELFETEKGKVSTGANIPVQDLVENGSVPRVTVTNSNNGICGYYDYCGNKPQNYRVYDNFISVSFLGTVFYHKGQASLDMKVHCLKPVDVELNKYTGSFLVSVVEKSIMNIDYSDQISSSVLYNMSLLLPATPSGSPDWAYMENYMKEMEKKAKERLDRLEEMRKQEKKKIDVSGWGEFKVGDLFDVSISKSIDKTYLNFIDDGEIEYIGRTAVNNGIQGKMNVLDNIIPNQHNVFSLAQIGDNVCLFRETPWYSSQNIFILHPKYKKIIAVEKFVSTVITKTMLSVYGCDAYASYPTLKTLKDVTLLLPVTSAGDPDWAYMKQYMREMEEKVRERLEKLGK